jgi:hypothetical protein
MRADPRPNPLALLAAGLFFAFSAPSPVRAHPPDAPRVGRSLPRSWRGMDVSQAEALRGHLSSRNAWKVVNSKYGMRVLGEGGPIAQPDFLRIVPRPSFLKQLRRRCDELRDDGPRYEMLPPTDAVSLDLLASSVAQGRKHVPLVLKPENGAYAKGMVHVERTRGRLCVTMKSGYAKTAAALEALKKSGATHDIVEEGDIVRIQLDASQRSAPVLESLWTTLAWSTYRFRTSDSYDVLKLAAETDFGFVEERLPLFSPEGRANETRHRLYGTFDGRARLVKKPKDDRSTPSDKTRGSFARWGSNEYFATHFGPADSEARREVLGWERMYEPLFREFNIRGSRQQQFVGYVDKLVLAQFAHYTRRAQAIGISLDQQVVAEIDLGWLPPTHKGGFPRPVIIEANMTDP